MVKIADRIDLGNLCPFLRSAELHGVTADMASFANTDLANADLSGASLSGASFNFASCRGASFEGASAAAERRHSSQKPSQARA